MRSALTKIPKWLLFSLLGAIGGALLCLLYEPLGNNDAGSRSYLGAVLDTACWIGFICVGIAAPVIAAQQVLLTGRPNLAGFLRPMAIALGLGFLSGALAQVFYSVLIAQFGRSLGELPRFPPWMLAGGGLGIALAFAIPNFRMLPGALWGMLGGLIGVSVFVVLGYLNVDVVASRFFGAAAIGFFVGLAIALAEKMAREGFLRVIWAPKEVATVNLGARPITVGTGKEVSIRLPASSRYPDLVATFRLVGGSATMQNHMSNSHHALRDGNKLNLGPVTIEVKLFS